jgi:hypothetical protein
VKSSLSDSESLSELCSESSCEELFAPFKLPGTKKVGADFSRRDRRTLAILQVLFFDISFLSTPSLLRSFALFTKIKWLPGSEHALEKEILEMQFAFPL